MKFRFDCNDSQRYSNTIGKLCTIKQNFKKHTRGILTEWNTKYKESKICSVLPPYHHYPPGVSLALQLIQVKNYRHIETVCNFVKKINLSSLALKREASIFILLKSFLEKRDIFASRGEWRSVLFFKKRNCKNSNVRENAEKFCLRLNPSWSFED